MALHNLQDADKKRKSVPYLYLLFNKQLIISNKDFLCGEVKH